MTPFSERASVGRRNEARMDFGAPPIIETSLGFYFRKIEGWNVLHQGVLWERFRNRYPVSEMLAPIMSISPQPSTKLIEVFGIPARTGFTDPTKTELVQMQDGFAQQDGFFLHNWRKLSYNNEYPHYETVNQRLQEDWAELRSYLTERSFEQLSVTRCQIDYFNQLVRGEDWQGFAELPHFFTVWSGFDSPKSGAGDIQTVSFSFAYRLGKGTVNVTVQPGIRGNDGKEIIQFTLASSAPPRSSGDQDLFACLDECHDNAVTAFLNFTTEHARERWGQR